MRTHKEAYRPEQENDRQASGCFAEYAPAGKPKEKHGDAHPNRSRQARCVMQGERGGE